MDGVYGEKRMTKKSDLDFSAQAELRKARRELRAFVLLSFAGGAFYALVIWVLIN